jgi:hypothetical protein
MVVVQIANPADGAAISSAAETALQVIAYDSAIGTSDGDGITSAEIRIRRPDGGFIVMSKGTTQTDNTAPYCAFDDNGSTCNTMDGATFATLSPGTYTILTRARSTSGTWSGWVSSAFVI